MTQQQKEEIKKEYSEFYDKNFRPTVSEQADYWLSKFDQLIQEKLEKIKKEQELYAYSDNPETSGICEGFEMALTILKD